MKRFLVYALGIAALSFSYADGKEQPVLEWVHFKSNQTLVPDSPVEQDGGTEEPTTINPANDNQPQIQISLKSEDLSSNYLPEYCRCVVRQYCPTEFQSRSKRTVNTPSCPSGNVMCCSPRGPGCGVVDPFPYFPPYPAFGEASFAEYPWTALIMDSSNQLYGIGTTIAWRTVITTARNLENYLGRRFKVRLGEWDLSSTNELLDPQEFYVSEVVIHPDFNPRTFQNDIAILRLNASINLDAYPHIRSACLPKPGDANKFINSKCVIAGWGNRPASRVSTVRNLLKEVDLQIYDAPSCQQAIRRAINNPDYYWDQSSFLCAGGQAGKGPCKGDEGGALICQDTPSSRYTVVGLSSWGNSCGEAGFPGVFTNMAYYYDWIKSVEPNIGQ